MDRLARPEEIIQVNYNRYSFSIPLDYYDPAAQTSYGRCENDVETSFYRTACLVEPTFWISSAPIKNAANGYDPDNYDQLTEEQKYAINKEYNLIYKPAFKAKFDVEKDTRTALKVYQDDHGQEVDSAFSVGFYGLGESLICSKPMLDVRQEILSYKFLDPDPKICGFLKTAGLQQPLIDDGFGYFNVPIVGVVDPYVLFRRDFYGESRYGTDVSVGAFQ